MAKILRDLLDAEEPIFSLALQQLEKASGRPGIDSRLIGEIAQKVRHAIEKLGLDPLDSTDREIYQAQLSRMESDSIRVTKLVGGKDPDDVRALMPLIIKTVEGMDINRTCWVLKHSVAKRLLKQMPPKQLMQHLGYRSIDSMLKSEDIDEIYTALRFSEGPEWLNQYNELFKTIVPSDFESRKIRIIQMDHDKYVDLAEHFVQKKLHNITHTKEMGTIVVVPMKIERMRGIVLKSLPLIFHYINEIRLYSSFFKLKQVQSNFGQTVVETLIADPATASSMAGNNVHWRVIQRYFGKIKDGNFPEAFEPHVHPEDLHWRKANEMLYDFDPEMEFWKDLDYVAVMGEDGTPISFNLLDVSFAYTNQERFANRYVYHFRESLWNEIFMRYMGQKNLEEQILLQLDNESVVPHKLKVPKPSARELRSLGEMKSDLLIRRKLIAAAEGRLIGVTEEFAKSFDVLERHEKTVTIFGSARLKEDQDAYKWAYNVASALAMKGFTTVTGGGYGIMEAANRGAYESGGQSIGFNINLPTEQRLNKYTTEHYTFEHFFGRKVTLTLDSSAYIYFPGGFGTMDELFEILTLAQTGKIPHVPIILFGKKFWEPLEAFINTVLLDEFKTINAADRHLYTITDDVEEVVRIVTTHKDDYKKSPQGTKPHPRSQE